jgi:23S rRNA (guanosine2251-2'-O)-methyltransferase
MTIISLEQNAKSISCAELKKHISTEAISQTLLILGNEVDGVAPEFIKISDFIAEIPMKGKKESLNVSVAAGIALFGIFG